MRDVGYLELVSGKRDHTVDDLPGKPVNRHIDLDRIAHEAPESLVCGNTIVRYDHTRRLMNEMAAEIAFSAALLEHIFSRV